MKKIISVFLLMAIMVVALPITGVQAASSKKVYKAYYNWIKKKAPKGYNSFKLIKLDNNNTPELLAVNHGADDDYFEYYILCTYKSGKIKEYDFISGFSASGSWLAESVSYIPKTGKILVTDYNRGNGDTEDQIYKLKSGMLKKTNFGKYAYNGPYLWNGKSVSEKNYDKKLNKAYCTKKAQYLNDLKYISKRKMLKNIKKKI